MPNDTAYCFDLDSTVTTTEILPQLSKELGIEQDMKLLTELTMQGLIPFERSFNLRIKLLSLMPLDQSVDIINRTPLSPSIAQFIRNNKSHCYIITGNLDCYITNLITENLGCKFYCSTADLVEGKLKGIARIVDKAAALAEVRKKYARVIAIGDGNNDIDMIKAADVGIAYGGVRTPPKALTDVADHQVSSDTELCALLESISA